MGVPQAARTAPLSGEPCLLRNDNIRPSLTGRRQNNAIASEPSPCSDRTNNPRPVFDEYVGNSRPAGRIRPAVRFDPVRETFCKISCLISIAGNYFKMHLLLNAARERICTLKSKIPGTNTTGSESVTVNLPGPSACALNDTEGKLILFFKRVCTSISKYISVVIRY
ncbi:hypothetical protein EVAR_16545_1 [Eumeta japonica]|uniref:Uncharacterized protein n=1 Tax=Eumeta variegata TaxID=151549 RepID=A0A4C1U2X9_EUMVA|nr:hypothetical protein EVAR_16545_1 [Eumeta japonica]